MSSRRDSSSGSLASPDSNELEASRNALLNSSTAPASPLETSSSPTTTTTTHFTTRWHGTNIRVPRPGLRSRQISTLTTNSLINERSRLLTGHSDRWATGYRTTSTPASTKYSLSRKSSRARLAPRDNGNTQHSRPSTAGGTSTPWWKPRRAFRSVEESQTSQDLPSAAAAAAATTSSSTTPFAHRGWYDQFTSTDWVRDSIADAARVKELRRRTDLRGRVLAFLDGGQGWALVAVIGCITAGFAAVVDVSEATVFDLKSGYCETGWLRSRKRCCDGASACEEWRRWSGLLEEGYGDGRKHGLDYGVYVGATVVLAMLSCWVTLQTRTTISATTSLDISSENLDDDRRGRQSTDAETQDKTFGGVHQQAHNYRPQLSYLPAAGSGVAEVRVILSGFVLHGYLGLKTLFFKALALILSVSSGLSIGKEGPYVHIATCVGNIVSRISAKYRQNDAKRRELLSASAASGVAVAFGAPIAGVLFSLEEISYYFPPKTLFRTFFCCIVAALSLKFLDPRSNNKIVPFEVRYTLNWKFFELIAFAILGVAGGVVGALFIKASRLWAKTFRQIGYIKRYPLLEVTLVAAVTGAVGYWNRLTRLPVTELLYELAAPCNAFSNSAEGLCPTEEGIPAVIRLLAIAFGIKAVLSTIAFGTKVPAGIYVPSMVVGGLLGRIVGHVVQLIILKHPDAALFTHCPKNGTPESCVVPGVYALVAAGATMCGVTRLSVTLAVILFELTGSLDHVLPFSLGVLIAKWTADALEPLSIYDSLIDINGYPYLDYKVRPVFDTELGDIVQPCPRDHVIDVSRSPLVSSRELRAKVYCSHLMGEVDGGLPIIRDDVLVGLIATPDLEFALDRLDGGDDSDVLCLMDPHRPWMGSSAAVSPAARTSRPRFPSDGDFEAREEVESEDETSEPEETADFTQHVDASPIALDVFSPMDLVFECFAKLGLRYLCVVQEGRFAGIVHKKTFVQYVKSTERQHLKQRRK